MLEPRRLLTFREVARRASFSRAAEALALTQPAVSQQVAALEREVGDAAARPRLRGLALTETGELLLGHADALASRLDAADAQLAELRAEREARLASARTRARSPTIVPDAIADGGPRSRPRTRRRRRRRGERGPSPTSPQGVRDGRVHVGVCFEDAGAPPREPPDARRHELATSRWRRPSAPPPARRAAADQALGARGRHVDRAVARAPRLPRVRRGRVRAADRLRHARPARDRGLSRAGLAVSLTPRLLAGRLEDVRTIGWSGDAPSRRLYALTPAVGARPRALRFVAALRRPRAERMRR